MFLGSEGEGDYTIADIEKPDRGTEITLHLREGEDEYLDDWRLRSIISKYSDHISLPVEIETKNERRYSNMGKKLIKRKHFGLVIKLKWWRE